MTLEEKENSNNQGISELVKEKVEQLRLKLLDLTARNPLIRTNLSRSTASYIRVVDELPDVLFSQLDNGNSMKFASLPPLEDEPTDEKSEIFIHALSAARNTDDEFKNTLDELDPNASDYLDKLQGHERALKDKVRAELGLPKRPTGKDAASLNAHAQSHGIEPTYDLPKVDNEIEAERHTDDEIQTLQLPRDMDRKLNGIISKAQTWQQETGVSVLQAAFGFLEWSDPNGKDTNFSPLIILPIALNKKKSAKGMLFSVEGAGDGAEINEILNERLKRDLGVSLPDYEGGSVEEYFEKVSSEEVQVPIWRVRRQVVFGIFPSARIAMYHDLDTAETDFQGNEIVSSMLAGRNPSTSSVFAEDYNIDEEERNGRRPLTVMDADSSQVSTLLDVMDGKTLAVEGPPGTGKSQTIVNIIAAALADGKKVLFIAEKLAALNVVKSRLESVGLGEFILPLQAEKSSREAVIKSIRQRLSLRDITSPSELSNLQVQLEKARDNLAEYISILKSKFQETNRTVHQIMGEAIATKSVLDNLPSELRDVSQMPNSKFTISDRYDVSEKAKHFEDMRIALGSVSNNWKGITRKSIAPFEADEILQLASSCANHVQRLKSLIENLGEVNLNLMENGFKLESLISSLKQFDAEVSLSDQKTNSRLISEENLIAAKQIIKAENEISDASEQASEILNEPLNSESQGKLRQLVDICQKHKLETPDLNSVYNKIANAETQLKNIHRIKDRVENFIRFVPQTANWTLKEFKIAREIGQSVPKEVLSLRSAALANDNAIAIFAAFLEQGKKLAIEEKKIEEQFVSFGTQTPAELHQDIAILKTANALSIFSSQVKRVKRNYLTISRENKFEKQAAISSLSQLSEFLDKKQALESDPKLLALFGPNFSASGTDFSKLELLSQFYSNVEIKLPGLEKHEVRNFLKSASIDQISALPDVGNIESDVTFEKLKSLISYQQANLDGLHRIVDKIKELSVPLKSPTETQIPQISAALVCIDRAFEIFHDLRDATKVLGKEGLQFSEVKSLSNGFRPWVELTSSIGRQISLEISPVIANGKLNSTIEKLDEISKLKKVCETDIQLLSEKASFEVNFSIDNLEEIHGKLTQLANDRQGLSAHVQLYAARCDMAEVGFGWVADAFMKNDFNEHSFPDVLNALIAVHLMRHIYKDYGSSLTKFSGATLQNLKEKLSELDLRIIQLSRQKLIAKLMENASPPQGNGIGKKSDYTQMALVFNEVEKRKRFVPVRDLIKRSGEAIAELKPCWMMSPQAVAQYIPKGRLKFDLCIIDEASQMPPEDAIGALARSEQAVIVGDTNQLPPSSFFQKMLDDSDMDDDSAETVLQESILEMAKQTYRPSRRLRWHYRSRHAGLINFSNKLIYDDDLVVFPSPDETRADMGVSLVQVEGSYKKGLNPDEARVVIDAAIKFMQEYPNRSLGIVTLNKAQADHLQEIFDNDALPSSKFALDYVEAWRNKNDGLESFFIKNLENVQGDERDAIFISTVYGPEKPGMAVAQRFGPINGIAGQRRLNVLFSRAKQQIVTFSSMTASDIVAAETGNKGAWMLKQWLQYSATGVLEGGQETGREPDSDFELYVIEQAKAIGCEPVPQVGVSGYFIDIGLRHPDWPHGFILGVECDGATYHSGKSARDRDRLRQSVLEGLGWKLHRIWSTDWFDNPRREAEILRKVVEHRLEELKAQNQIKNASEVHNYLNRQQIDNSQEIADSEGELQTSLQFSDSGINANVAETQFTADTSSFVEIGDTVRVRFLTHGEDTIQVTISDEGNNQDQGVIGSAMPLAEALIDAREGEEIELLRGSYLRRALIEKVTKAQAA